NSQAGFLDQLKMPRSSIPAVTHVDYSARVQTVSEEENPRFYALLRAFEAQTGCAVLVNTSFNVRGEPPVCTPEEAFRCFMRTDMDYLVLGNFLIEKSALRREAPGSDAFSRGGEADQKQSAVGRPAPSVLRRFGLTTGLAFFVLGAILEFRHRSAGRPFASLAVLLLLFSVIAPALLRFVYRPWMAVANFLGAIISRLLLTLVFFFVVTPIGTLQRLFGKHLVDLRFRSHDAT